MLAGFDHSLRALDRELRDARVALDVAIIRTGHDFRTRAVPAKIRYFFRTFIHEENDQFHLRMIFDDRVRNVMQQGRLAGARWRDNQTALAHTEDRKSTRL